MYAKSKKKRKLVKKMIKFPLQTNTRNDITDGLARKENLCKPKCFAVIANQPTIRQFPIWIHIFFKTSDAHISVTHIHRHRTSVTLNSTLHLHFSSSNTVWVSAGDKHARQIRPWIFQASCNVHFVLESCFTLCLILDECVHRFDHLSSVM